MGVGGDTGSWLMPMGAGTRVAGVCVCVGGVCYRVSCSRVLARRAHVSILKGRAWTYTVLWALDDTWEQRRDRRLISPFKTSHLASNDTSVVFPPTPVRTSGRGEGMTPMPRDRGGSGQKAARNGETPIITRQHTNVLAPLSRRESPRVWGVASATFIMAM